MDPISNISPIQPLSGAQTASLLSVVGDPVAAAFEDLIDQLVLKGPSKSSALSQSAIEAQQKVADFRRKLALLSGMLEQAQIAMGGEKPLPGGLPSPAAAEYFFVRSELARVGLPGEVNDIV